MFVRSCCQLTFFNVRNRSGNVFYYSYIHIMVRLLFKFLIKFSWNSGLWIFDELSYFTHKVYFYSARILSSADGIVELDHTLVTKNENFSTMYFHVIYFSLWKPWFLMVPINLSLNERPSFPSVNCSEFSVFINSRLFA